MDLEKENETDAVVTEAPENIEWWESYENSERLKCYLYKKDSAGKYPQITRYDGYIPDPHDIGLQYGGGDYRANIRYPDSQTNKLLSTTKHFELGDHYDSQHKTENSGLSGGSPALTPDAISGAVVSSLMGIVREVAPLIMPLFTNKKDPTFGDTIQDLYRSSTSVLEDSMKSQSKMMSGMMKEFTGSMKESFSNLSSNQVAYQNDPEEFESEEEEEDAMSIVGKMAWGFLEPHIMAILQGGGSELIEQAKNNPLFQTVINNPEAVQEIQGMILNQFGMPALIVINEKLGLQ